MYQLFIELVNLVESLGYLGLFIMTMVEGTFIPIPNELTLIPAGFLVAKGLMKMWIVLVVSILGNICGALINYYIAYHYGRSLVQKYGKYVFFTEEKLAKVEGFFKKHGPISVFIGRIMPGLKHFISFPAGLGKMNLKQFCIYTGSGGAIWVILLVVLGNIIGSNEELVARYIKNLNWTVIIGGGLAIAIYVFIHKRKSNQAVKNPSKDLSN